MAFNMQLLDDAIDWAKAEHALGVDSLWRQYLWAGKTDCGTACCIAGRIALSTGHAFDDICFNAQPAAELELGAEFLPNLGREALSLMFGSDNDLLALQEYRDYIAAELGLPPRFGGGNLDLERIEDDASDRFDNRNDNEEAMV